MMSWRGSRSIMRAAAYRLTWRFAQRRLIQILNEDGYITAKRNLDAHRFRSALTGEVFRQALAQLAGIIANNIVLDRSITGWAVKHLYADLVLGNLACTALQRFG